MTSENGNIERPNLNVQKCVKCGKEFIVNGEEPDMVKKAERIFRGKSMRVCDDCLDIPKK